MLTKTTTFNEFLARANDDGVYQAAHVVLRESVKEDGVEITSRLVGPMSVEAAAAMGFGLPDVISALNQSALSQVDALTAEKQALAKERDDALVQLAVIKPVEINGIPQSVTRFQALAVLDADGLLDRVTAIMNDANTPRIAKLAWDNAQSFDRSSPTIASLAGALGLTEPMLDDLFIAAAKIKA